MNQAAKILVVDDNAPFRLLIAAFLQKAGYAALQAENGQQALEVMTRETPALLLVDLQMENLGGFDFMKEYVELGYTAPAVMITGDPGVDVLIHATKLGFVAVLKKPVTESRVIQMVQRYVA